MDERTRKRLEMQTQLAYIEELLYKLEGYEAKRKIGTIVLSLPGIDKIVEKLQRKGFTMHDDRSVFDLLGRLRAQISRSLATGYESWMGPAEDVIVQQLRAYLTQKEATLRQGLRKAA